MKAVCQSESNFLGQFMRRHGLESLGKYRGGEESDGASTTEIEISGYFKQRTIVSTLMQ